MRVNQDRNIALYYPEVCWNL